MNETENSSPNSVYHNPIMLTEQSASEVFKTNSFNSFSNNSSVVEDQLIDDVDCIVPGTTTAQNMPAIEPSILLNHVNQIQEDDGENYDE